MTKILRRANRRNKIIRELKLSWKSVDIQLHKKRRYIVRVC